MRTREQLYAERKELEAAIKQNVEFDEFGDLNEMYEELEQIDHELYIHRMRMLNEETAR